MSNARQTDGSTSSVIVDPELLSEAEALGRSCDPELSDRDAERFARSIRPSWDPPSPASAVRVPPGQAVPSELAPSADERLDTLPTAVGFMSRLALVVALAVALLVFMLYWMAV